MQQTTITEATKPVLLGQQWQTVDNTSAQMTLSTNTISITTTAANLNGRQGSTRVRSLSLKAAARKSVASRTNKAKYRQTTTHYQQYEDAAIVQHAKQVYITSTFIHICVLLVRTSMTFAGCQIAL